MPERDHSRLARLQGYLSVDPENVRLRCDAFDAALAEGELDVARDLVTQDTTVSKADHRLSLRRGIIAFHSGDNASAMQFLVSVEPDTPAEVLQRDFYAACCKEVDQDFRGMVETLLPHMANPDAPQELLTALARGAHSQGDLLLAGQVYKRITRHFGEDGPTLANQAIAALDLNEMVQAKEFAERALKLDVENATARLVMGACALANRESESALSLFEESLAAFPTSGRALSGIGLAHLLEHRFDEAAQNLEKAITLMPNHLGTYVALAWAYIFTQNFERAERSIERAHAIDDTFAESHGTLAVACVLNGDTERAKRFARTANRINPKNFSGRFAQALQIGQADPRRFDEIVNRMLDQPIGADGASLRDLLTRGLGR